MLRIYAIDILLCERFAPQCIGWHIFRHAKKFILFHIKFFYSLNWTVLKEKAKATVISYLNYIQETTELIRYQVKFIMRF